MICPSFSEGGISRQESDASISIRLRQTRPGDSSAREVGVRSQVSCSDNRDVRVAAQKERSAQRIAAFVIELTNQEQLSDNVSKWLQDRGYTLSERVSGGRNNRMFKVCGASGAAALKVYYRGANDNRDRFSAERTCYSLAAKTGVAAPQWLDADEKLGVALLGWINGAPLGVDVGEAEVDAAAEFLVTLNRPSPSRADFPHAASEACFSVEQHVQLLQNRIGKLEQSSAASTALGDFFGVSLPAFFARFRETLPSKKKAEFRDAGHGALFSPGDFGLHNALRRDDGSIVFFDFEYSGWDDPVKTVADVFLQPEKPVDWKFLPRFCARLEDWPGLEERTRAWLPFFAAKWAVILLGPVAKDAAERRRFAGQDLEAVAIERQIEKASKVLLRVEHFLN